MSKVLTIQRSKWRRGGEGADLSQGETELLNSRGLMCCLGFDALACGVSEDAIREIGAPHIITAHVPDEYRATRVNAEINEVGNPIGAAMEINDDDEIGEDERERRVREQLLRLGWDDVLFVD